MSEFRRRFDPSELEGIADEEAAGLVEVARDLEAYADVGWSGPSLTFEDRVMTAIAAEPPPRLAAGLGALATLREAWRLAWSGGRPVAVRAQAIAFVMAALLAVGAVGSFGVVAASRLLAPQIAPPPTEDHNLAPTERPTPTPKPTPSPTATPTPTPDTTAPRTAKPTTSTETEDPSGTDDHSGSSGSGGSGGSSGSEGSEEPGLEEDHSGSGGVSGGGEESSPE